MVRKTISVVMMAGLMSTASFAAGPDNPFGVEWDAQAVSQMSREDRLAYQRQYKAAVEEAARQAGTLQPRNRQPTGRMAEPTLVPGTSITYHSGALSPSASSSVSVGNRFNTAITTMGGMGPVEMSGSITMFTADMAGVGGTGAFFSLYDQLNGTTANQITSMTVPLVTGMNTATLATPLNYVGSSFLAGIWNFTAASDTVNVATGTVMGQGFHGMEINDGGTGTGFVAYTMTNGTVGVSGDVATPVELLSFQID
ncbi:MAG: hypothetical protein AAF725_20975 [Acidobacteriota bacterium]